jgi:hypothetical protein
VELAGLGDDLRLPAEHADLRVQHLVGDALLAEQVRQPLGLLDRHGADEDGLALLVALGEVLDDGVELRLLGLVDEVALVDRWTGLFVGMGTTDSS